MPVRRVATTPASIIAAFLRETMSKSLTTPKPSKAKLALHAVQGAGVILVVFGLLHIGQFLLVCAFYAACMVAILIAIGCIGVFIQSLFKTVHSDTAVVSNSKI